MLKRTLLSLALAITVLPLAACNDDDESISVIVPVATQNIVEIAANDDRFTTLVLALQTAGLADALTDDEYTVFAPTNAAFDAFLAEKNLTVEQLLADNEESRKLLTDVLTYHVVANTTVTAADIPFDDSIETLNKQAITISQEDGNVVITDASGDEDNTATITETDLIATNGVLHVIDDVLFPTDKTIVDLAVATPDLSILRDAVVAAGLAETLSNPDANFTVFAPNNAAFEALLADLNLTAEQLLSNKELLVAVLTYHVIDDRVFESEIEVGAQPQTVNGETFTFQDEDTIVDSRGSESDIEATNIQASNGVVHVIDRVLLPTVTPGL